MLDTLETYVWDVVTGWNLRNAYTRAAIHALKPPLLLRVVSALTRQAATGEVGGSNTTTG